MKDFLSKIERDALFVHLAFIIMILYLGSAVFFYSLIEQVILP